MDIVNPNYLNYMEQIQKNREDIEKLYDQELSDITQLNFEEYEENGLNYENGKATFLGQTTIIRDENTENLLVDSKVEIKISGSDDIVVDAGEDNSTLEIHLDNETRNKINRALLTPITTPTERSFVMIGTNNSELIVGEEELLQKNIITAKLIANYHPTGNTGLETLPLIEHVRIGNKLSINNSSEIVIGEGVTTIKASALARTNFGGYSGSMRLDICKNGTWYSGSRAVQNGSAMGVNPLSIDPILIPVIEGDKITLKFWRDAGDYGYVEGYNTPISTYMTVEVVE